MSTAPVSIPRFSSPLLHDMPVDMEELYLSPNGMNDALVDFPSADSDQLLFGPLDLEDNQYPSASPKQNLTPMPHFDAWPAISTAEMDLDADLRPSFDLSAPSSASTSYGFGPPSFPSSLASFGSPSFPPNSLDPKHPPFDSFHLSSWINDQVCTQPTAASPIPIPSNSAASDSTPFVDQSSFGIEQSALSPAGFAALHPLPASVSPSRSAFDSGSLPFPRQRVDSFESSSPHDASLQTPVWASQLWDTQHTSSLRSPSSPRHAVRHSPMADVSHRTRATSKLDSAPTSLILASSSAPSSAPVMTRSYARRAESASTGDELDGTVRRKKLSAPDKPADTKGSELSPLKSTLKVPKLAPSAWQLYFTDWIQRQQATSTRKLNVAQAAKEAGAEYASLSAEEKEPYKRRSQAAKEAREREHNAYMRTLTPDDIKRENAFRAAQRKAGRSRKSNLKDPNAPKKPLSAYFMFLQRIRSDARLVSDIFGDETETTKQSVLAAAKWRSMTDEERKPFLAQAEQEKMEYEAARRLYEEGTTGYGQSINFSILPPGSTFGTIKMESETEDDPPDKVSFVPR